jgi:hypothetical protein
MKEMFTTGPANANSGFPQRIFPSTPDTLESSLNDYYEKMDDLASLILRVFALNLNLGKTSSISLLTTTLQHFAQCITLRSLQALDFCQDSSGAQHTPTMELSPFLEQTDPAYRFQKTLTLLNGTMYLSYQTPSL